MSDESVVSPVKMTATKGSYVALIFAILFSQGCFITSRVFHGWAPLTSPRWAAALAP